MDRDLPNCHLVTGGMRSSGISAADCQAALVSVMYANTYSTTLTSKLVYKLMCRPCGVFSYADSAHSLPGSLQLSGKTALGTRARVNLG